MKSKIILPAILILFSQISSAQNMIANNGFETYSSLPSGPGEWWKVTGWNNVNNQAVFAWPYASPDYLSTNGIGSAHLPNSIFGNVNPYAGNSVMGFVAYYNPGATDFREYISRALSTPMVIGQQYTVSFMMTNGDSLQYNGSGCNHIGVYFSLSPLTQLQHEPINVTPQCEISTIWWNTSWKLVSFTLTAAAAFQYITIGNFYNDVSTIHTVFNAASISSFGAYYFIDEIIVQPTIPLPVKLVSFSGENKSHINHLYWTTATEINNDYFDVERSWDGIFFEKIGRDEGSGNSSQILNYEFDDTFPFIGINYYRLKQVDYNGEFKYSNVIAVKTNDLINTCFISSVKNNIFTFKCSEISNGFSELLNVDGKILKHTKIADSNEIKIDLSDFSQGIYFCKIISNEKFHTFKIIKN